MTQAQKMIKTKVGILELSGGILPLRGVPQPHVKGHHVSWLRRQRDAGNIFQLQKSDVLREVIEDLDPSLVHETCPFSWL